MSSARNAFLGICGLPIWAAGDVAWDWIREKAKAQEGRRDLGSAEDLAGLIQGLQLWSGKKSNCFFPKAAHLVLRAGSEGLLKNKLWRPETAENFCNNERSEELILNAQIREEYKKETKKRHALSGKYVNSTYRKIRVFSKKRNNLEDMKGHDLIASRPFG